MSTKKAKKKSWIILNMEDGFWYWVEDAESPNAAIQEYLQECVSDQPEYSMTLQVCPVTKYDEFEVSRTTVSKTVDKIKLVKY